MCFFFMTLFNTSATVKFILLSKSFYCMWTSCVSVFDFHFLFLPSSSSLKRLETEEKNGEENEKNLEEFGGNIYPWAKAGKRAKTFLTRAWKRNIPNWTNQRENFYNGDQSGYLYSGRRIKKGNFSLTRAGKRDISYLTRAGKRAPANTTSTGRAQRTDRSYLTRAGKRTWLTRAGIKSG